MRAGRRESLGCEPKLVTWPPLASSPDALRAREARGQVERQGDLDSPVGGEDRTVVGQPLHRMRRTNTANALLDTADHHVTDHLAGEAGGGRNRRSR